MFGASGLVLASFLGLGKWQERARSVHEAVRYGWDGLGLDGWDFCSAVLAVDRVGWVAGFAAGAESFQGLWSGYGEGFVWAGVKVELVSAFALVACNVVGLEFPFSLGWCLYCASAPWTVQSH